jgi:hypothetical protein
VSSNLSRKELKEDKFAVEVEHTVDFFAAHRKEITRYGSIAAVILLIGAGAYYYMKPASASRQKALGEAIALTDAPVTTTPPPTGAPSFATQAAKNDATVKAFTKVQSEYSGQDEGYVAEYFLAAQAADAGSLNDARKKYQDVVDHANANYASLAKLALAQIDFAQNKSSEAESLLKSLIDNPTDMVSKTEATIALAKGIGATRPDEARKLLQPLIAQSPEVASIVTAALGELPQK